MPLSDRTEDRALTREADDRVGAELDGRVGPESSRRRAIGIVGAAVSAGIATAGRTAAGAPSRRSLRIDVPAAALVPRADLVDVLEYEAQAGRILGPAEAALIAGSERSIADRITLRPRMNIPTKDLDLTSTLFGDRHFAPIIVGPVAHQKRFHPDGELATAKGAAAAKAGMVISGESSIALEAVYGAGTTPMWLQVAAQTPRLTEMLARAKESRVKAVVVTVGAGATGTHAEPASARVDWRGVDAVRRATSLPVIVKGIVHPTDAKEAVARGAQGIVVSTYRGARSSPSALLLIAPVVAAVGARVPVLADGSFRRGTDVIKALAFGASAVLVARPVMWGLAAYGPEGVQGVVEMLQTELARYMCMCGRPSLAAVDPSLVRVHAPLPGNDADHG